VGVWAFAAEKETKARGRKRKRVAVEEEEDAFDDYDNEVEQNGADEDEVVTVVDFTDAVSHSVKKVRFFHCILATFLDYTHAQNSY
jgi:ketosteroid isomerase-like protein